MAQRKLQYSFKALDVNKYKQNNEAISSFYIGYKSIYYNVLLEVFSSRHGDEIFEGIRQNMEIGSSWLRLSQGLGFFNLSEGNIFLPIHYYNHLSITFAPDIWLWKNARYQPFVGLESYYIKKSDKIGIDPSIFPIYNDFEQTNSPSHLINMEFGFFVNHFKISYRWIKFNMFDEDVKNSTATNPIYPIRHLEVVWQFLN